MKQYIFYFLIILTACKDVQEDNRIVEINDTTEALTIILDSAFSGGHFNIQNFINYTFNDSIIFVDDTLIHGKLPQLDNLKFKFLTRDSICKLATLNQLNSRRFPDILTVPIFRKTSSGYHLMLESQCVIPIYDTFGKLKHSIAPNADTTEKCWYKLFCTSSISLTLIYKNDSIICNRIRFGAS